VRSISSDSADCDEASPANSASPFVLFLPSGITTESSDEMGSSRETTRPPENVETTAGCSETTAVISTHLIATSDVSGLTEEAENMHAEHSVTTSEKGEMQPCNTDGRSSPVPSVHHQATVNNNKVITRNYSTTEIPHAANAPVPTVTDSHTPARANESKQPHVAQPHVANTRPSSAANRMTSVEKESKISTSTSPFSLIEACSKNQRNKVRYKNAGRYGQRRNCRPTKTLQKERQKKQRKYHQYNSTIQQM